MYHAESPLLRSAPAPLYLLSRLVADAGYKVVVTGEGADEVLAGYDIFREGRLREFWLRDPASTVRDQAVSLLYPWLVRSPGAAPAFARQFFGKDLDPDDLALSHRPRWSSTSALKHMLTPDARAAGADPSVSCSPACPPTPTRGTRSPAPSGSSRPPFCRATSWPSQGDRMLMANSVEGRFPFLDRDVVEFAMALPARHKLLGLDEKHILKRAFADVVPDADPRSDRSSRTEPRTRRRSSAAARSRLAGRDRLAGAQCATRASSSRAWSKRSSPSARRTEGVRMSNTDNMRILAVISTQLLHRQFVVDGGGQASRGRRHLPNR